MAQRRSPAHNNLQEAIAILIRNQAAFVEQIARNDQERLALQLRSEEWRLRREEWERRSDERFEKIQARLAKIEQDLLDLPETVVQTILDQLPRIKKEIGFKSPPRR